MDENKHRLLLETFAIIQSVSGGYSFDSIDDLLMKSNPKVFNYSNSILCEMLNLLEENYSEEDIILGIDNMRLDDIDELSSKEKEYLKKDAKKTLKRIINNRKGE